jgi:hypothetical protein
LLSSEGFSYESLLPGLLFYTVCQSPDDLNFRPPTLGDVENDLVVDALEEKVDLAIVLLYNSSHVLNRSDAGSDEWVQK